MAYLTGVVVLFMAIPAPQKPRVQYAPSTLYLSRDGQVLREVLSSRETISRWVKLDEISPHLQHAAIVSEDRYFYKHPGVNPLALVRAAFQNIKARRIISGGSTITMQLAKSYWPRKHLLGKINEVRLAVWLDLRMSKEQILEEYFNRLPFGNMCYGVEAASRIYFGKSPANLSPAEAAFLMVIPRAAGYYNPYRRSHMIKRKRDLLLERMRGRKFLNALELARSQAEPVMLNKFRLNFLAPHLVDHLIVRGDKPDTQGRVLTTIDFAFQQEVEKIMRHQLNLLSANLVSSAAVIVIDNRTGEVLAYSGAPDYFNVESSGQIDGVCILRQPGSSIKPFTYLAALEQGTDAGTVIPDLAVSYTTTKGTYAPVNYDRKFHGPVLMRYALASSLNIAAVRLIDRIGVQRVYGLLKNFGVSSLNRPPQYYGLGLTLGAGEITLLEMARAYSALANQGIISDIVFVKGERPVTSRVADPAQVFILSEFLTDDLARSLEFGRYGVLNLPFPAAVKTGTSKNFRDNWCIGYTPDITVGVWVGNFSGMPMYNVSGVTGAALIWREVMLCAARKYGVSQWYKPPAGLVQKRICPLSGRLAGGECPGGIDEWFAIATAPQEKCEVHRRVKIDSRNGLLAGDSCLPQNVTEKIFVFLPSIYSSWAQCSGLETAPVSFSPLCPKSGAEPTPAKSYLRITYPDDHATFAMDPGIPEKFQILIIQADTNIDSSRLRWFVNDLPAQMGRFILKLPLKQGKYSVKVSVDGADAGCIDMVSFLVK